MARDPELIAHQEWLGYLQPVGLVVSPPALAAAQAFPAKNIIPDHARFLDLVEQTTVEGEDDPQPAILEFPRFATQLLGWEPADLLGSPDGDSVPETLEVALPEYNETLCPSYAVPEFDKTPDGDRKWIMLIQRVKLGIDLDETPESDSKGQRWQASPQARFERLLRESQVPIGLLSNGTHLRLVYAPRGETSGHLTFPVQAMTEVAGRPIFAALQMLLSAERLFTLPDKQRLPYILAESRKYQNLVSTKLAEQVLAALYELLRGFQAADDQRHGELLRDVLKDDPNQVYAGLLRVLLRLVFILYAEDRSLLSNDEVYQKYYSVIGLFERLREDAGRHTDTMDHRFGAWAQLLTLFRLIYDGGRHGGMKLLPRKGYLFDPNRSPFLEGRPKGSVRQPGERTEPPRVSDGVVFRVLQNLLILDGERLSYRTLDVEQIGSVYETMMGFNLEVAQGRSIAIKPTKPHGAPTTINLEELLAAKPADRAKWLKEKSDQAVTGQAAVALKKAATPEDAVAALERKVSFAATPRVVPAGAMVLQPSHERRRSGSHYTPRILTEPIVVTTFRPISECLGPSPTPEQILDLRVCDPAMGSGAFLVAVCRFLADLLVRAWHAPQVRADHTTGRGRDPPRPPHRGPALPVWGGQEPDGGRPGQALPLAGHAGEGSSVYVFGPRFALRRFAGGADEATDRRVPLATRETAGLRASGDRGATHAGDGPAAGDSRGPRRHVRSTAPREVAGCRRIPRSRPALRRPRRLSFLRRDQRPSLQGTPGNPGRRAGRPALSGRCRPTRPP